VLIVDIIVYCICTRYTHYHYAHKECVYSTQLCQSCLFSSSYFLSLYFIFRVRAVRTANGIIILQHYKNEELYLEVLKTQVLAKAQKLFNNEDWIFQQEKGLKHFFKLCIEWIRDNVAQIFE
jgi:hypothetical protein